MAGNGQAHTGLLPPLPGRSGSRQRLRPPVGRADSAEKIKVAKVEEMEVYPRDAKVPHSGGNRAEGPKETPTLPPSAGRKLRGSETL